METDVGRLSKRKIFRRTLLMVFVTVGSLKNPFNRLFEYIDRLVAEGIIDKEDIFAQIGNSTYPIKNYKFAKEISKSEFDDMMSKCDIVVCHAGTGCVVSGLEHCKKVIAVPRKKELGEHSDNHQFEIAEAFINQGYILCANSYEEFKKAFLEVKDFKPAEFKSNTESFVFQLVSELKKMNISN